MVTVTLFVNSFDGTLVQWTEYGSSPYLHDTVGDSIQTSTSGVIEKVFGFADIPEGAIITSVGAYFFGENGYGYINWDTFEVKFFDGTDWQETYTAIKTSVPAVWHGPYDLTSFLNTWQKVNAAGLEVKNMLPSGKVAAVYKAKLVVEYEIPAKPANPLIGKPLIAPDVIKKAKIR